MCDLVSDKLYDSVNKKLIPEDDDYGNIEYKRSLDKKDQKKLNSMVIQMMGRMARGHMDHGIYDANYILGVDDDGSLSCLSRQDLIITSRILRSVVSEASAKVISEKIYELVNSDNVPSFVMHVYIKKDFKLNTVPECNIYLIGATDVSKTSILSNLVHGQTDNTLGFSRDLSLRHPHEKQTGMTSSNKFETIGSDGENIVNYENSMSHDQDFICAESVILFNIIDLPGNPKYMKTICHSILTLKPDLILLCIPAYCAETFIKNNFDIYEVFFKLCKVLNLQPLIVLTKSDHITDKKTDEILKSFNCCVDYLKSYEVDTKDINYVVVNNVFNKGIDDLKEYLVSYGNSVLSHLDSDNDTEHVDNDNEHTDNDDRLSLFRFIDVFTMVGVGTIIHGILESGSLIIGDKVNVICHGSIMERKIISIHRKAMDVDILNKGETGCIMLSNTDKSSNKNIDKTGIIISDNCLNFLTSSGYLFSTYSKDNTPNNDESSLSPKQYLMFVDNSIVSVLLEETTDVHKNKKLFSFKTRNSNSIFLKNKYIPAILRDENKKLFFVTIVNDNI